MDNTPDPAGDVHTDDGNNNNNDINDGGNNNNNKNINNNNNNDNSNKNNNNEDNEDGGGGRGWDGVGEQKSNITSESSITNEPNESTSQKFNIILEEEFKEDRSDTNQTHLFYLPLAVGSSNMTAEAIGREFITFGNTTNNPSDSELLLKDLGKSLLKNNQSDVESSTSSNQNLANTESNTSSSNSTKFELVTPELLSSDQIPESIVQQFNQIAKLNKNNLRSRRTVRTITSKLNTSFDAKRQASFEETKPFESAIRSDANSSSAASSPNSSSQLQTISSKLASKSFMKDVYHARFHSDEITSSLDHSYKMNIANTQDPDNQTDMNKDNQMSMEPNLQDTNVRNRCSNVFRSKSALSTISSIRREQNLRKSGGQQSDPITQVGDSPYNQSIVQSGIMSQCRSSMVTGSGQGSSSSLRSLDATAACGPIAESDTIVSTTDQLVDSVHCGCNTESENLSTVTINEEPSTDIDEHATSTVKPAAIERSDEATVDAVTEKMNAMLAKRRHSVKELIHVEKEYVNALTTLVNVYMIPLRQEKILDDQQIDTIFFKVQELLMYHMSFLNTLQMWDLTNTVGDKLLDMFSREAVAMCYCTFVDNFPNSEKVLEESWKTKSSFQKFCDLKLRMNRNKLPLKALLVQPVQRLPRYELLIKRLLEYTPKTFSDHALLVEAQTAVHRVALRVNAVHTLGEDDNIMDGVKLIEKLLAPATLTPNRQYVRHDIVSLEERKDPVCIFMFTDQIVFTVARRRGSQVIKKPIFLRLQSIRGVDAIENIKYKIYHRLGIEAIEFESRAAIELEHAGQHKELRDKKDLALLAEIENISNKLDYRHCDLDAVVRRMYMTIQKELEDLRAARNAVTALSENLSVFTETRKEAIERHKLMFPNAAKRKEWEQTILELKRQLSSVKRTAKFTAAIPIPRSLTGIQLSCASTVEFGPQTDSTTCDVLICGSDGYTSCVCLFTIYPKPVINFNIPLTGCTSRITCMCAIPSYVPPVSRRLSHTTGNTNSAWLKGVTDKKGSAVTIEPLLENPDPADSPKSSKDGTRSDESVTIKSHSTNSKETTNTTLTETRDSEERKSSLVSENNYQATTPPDTPTNTESTIRLSDEEAKTEDDGTSICEKSTMVMDEQDPDLEAEAVKRSDTLKENEKCEVKIEEKLGNESNRQSVFTDDPDDPTSNDSDSSDSSEVELETVDRSSTVAEESSSNNLENETICQEESTEIKPETQSVTQAKNNMSNSSQPLMWLGTEDGSILMFYASDNLKTSRQRQKFNLTCTVNTILHFDLRVFVACANGDLLVYKHNSDGLWDMDSPTLVNLQPDSNEPSIVRRMLSVAGKIWCAFHRSICILDPVTLKVELSFPLNGNSADPRGIQLMAYGNQTVWLATENSSRISMYHATTGEFLMEIDVKPVVLERLHGCDEIIMRHKEACLRITCLTVCKDLLWVGTSAGVIVTIAIPKIGLEYGQDKLKQPHLETLSQGHIGQVRFLVTLEIAADELDEKYYSGSEHASDAICSTDENQQSHKSNQSSLLKDNSLGSHDSADQNTKSDMARSIHSQYNANKIDGSNACESGDIDRLDLNIQTTNQPPSESVPSQSPKHLSQPHPHQYHHHHHHHTLVRRQSANPCTTIATKMKVISGGEGLEEFHKKDSIKQCDINLNTNLGDNDSINHVLIWDVH